MLIVSVCVASRSIPSVYAQAVDFPHVEANKDITPLQTEQDGTVRVTITLRGAGGTIRTDVDVILTMDRSGSMAGDKIADAKIAAQKFLDFMDDSDRAGLVSYSSRISSNGISLMGEDNKNNLKDEIDSMRAQGSTNIYGAIEEANQILLADQRVNTPLVQILLTDGKHNYPTRLSDSDFIDLAKESASQGICIYTIGLGDDVNEERLRLIAEFTGAAYFFAPTSDDLESIFIEIASRLSFAGTDITVTETVPSYITYNGDASHSPAESSGSDGLILTWDVGTLRVDETWEVTYTANADEAVEVDAKTIQTKVEYITAESASAIINLSPGLIFHKLAITSFLIKPVKVTEGELVNITLTVENQGIVSDTFAVRTDVNGTIIDNRNISLNDGESENIFLQWNTSEVDPGRYIITVEADPDNQIWESTKTDNVRTGEVEVEEQIGSFLWIVIIFLLIATIAIAGVTYGQRYVRQQAPIAARRCPHCGSALEYSRVSKRWYCPKCRKYYDTRVQRKTPPPRPKGKLSPIIRRQPLPIHRH